MSEHGKFFVFPLCWFAAPAPWEEQVGRMFGYGVTYYLLGEHGTVGALRSNRSEVEEEARRVIGFHGGSLNAWIDDHGAIVKWEAQFAETTGGKTFHPRISTNLYFEARNGDGLTERDFKVHVALLSALGSKGYVRLGWKPIQYRAAGYLKRPPEGVAVYSRGQIERSLRELVARGLWVCYSYGRGKNAGERYWSNRLTLEQLVAAVCAAKQKQQDAYATMQAKAVGLTHAHLPALTNVSENGAAY